MSTEADIVERLRKHVNDRGGASIDNGAWRMMLDAADEIELARAMCDEALQSGHKWRSAARDMRERCAKVAEEKAQEFRSPEYAVNQPFSSTAERFACAEVAKAIRAMPETNGPTGTVIATVREGGATD